MLVKEKPLYLSSALFWRFGAKDDVINDVIIALICFCKSEVIFGGEEDRFSTYGFKKIEGLNAAFKRYYVLRSSINTNTE